MSKPTFQTAPSLRSLTLSGGLWVLEAGSVATIEFTPGTSGNDSPFTRYRVIWGDGSDETAELAPVGRAYFLSHQYLTPGNVTIQVQLFNSQGESSDPTGGVAQGSVLPIRVLPTPERAKRPVKWTGMTLPVATVAQAVGAVATAYPLEATALAAPATKGSLSITVAAVPEPAIAARVMIFQAGKLISSGTVISATLNVLQLDAAMTDDYDPWVASVEIQRATLPRTPEEVYQKPDRWFFPSKADRDVVRSSMALLMGTRPYERVMRPELGNRFHELPFDPNSALTRAKGQRYITDALGSEPRAKIEELTTTPSDDGFTTHLKVRFVPFTDEIFSLDIPLT